MVELLSLFNLGEGSINGGALGLELLACLGIRELLEISLISPHEVLAQAQVLRTDQARHPPIGDGLFALRVGRGHGIFLFELVVLANVLDRRPERSSPWSLFQEKSGIQQSP